MISQIRDTINQILLQSFSNIEKADFMVEETSDKFGDYSTNIAMILAAKTGDKPQEIANKIIEELTKNELYEKVEIAGPGFINFKINPEEYQKAIADIITAGNNYGASDLGKDLKYNIEFISANPTGPLTIGNARGGVIGDTLANVLAVTGHKVTREYYFNDAGGQIDILGHSILKDEQAEYKGEYIDEISKQIKSTEYKEVGQEAAQIIIGWIKDIFSRR